MIGGLVLAAGAGRRFGAPKQLARLGERPLLEHALAATAAAPVDRAVVVVGARAEEILAGVDLHGVEPVICPEWGEGQAASLRAGLAALADADAVAVVLGDQPLVSADAVARVIASRRPVDVDAARASYRGRPGHPVVLERQLFPRLGAVSGDIGARELLAGARVRAVPCDGLGRNDDVDTPEDLEAVRQAFAGVGGSPPPLPLRTQSLAP